MKKLKIGVFGAWRGNNYVNLINDEERAELVAVCDKNAEKLDSDKGLENVRLFRDFDSFLAYGKENGMQAVFLANYFHQHTPFAIRCMEAGMDVVSECTASATLRECAQLVETVEKTGRKYMLAENYPFSTNNLKMDEIIQTGALGRLLYAEGEYNHSGSAEQLKYLTPGPYHWRAWMPRTYYVTHAMGPLMYFSRSMPLYVSARAAHSDLVYEMRSWRHAYDGVGMMFCEMSNGMIARFTGCTAMASDYSRYRVVGDVASVETGNNIPDQKVRMFWFEHTKPEGQESQVKEFSTDPDSLGELGKRIKAAGHGGGDFWIVQHMLDYFLDGVVPFFDVYKAVAMSATAILGWRSCLAHGENFRIPDFRDPEDRRKCLEDDLTPFPDENGQGATLPCALPWVENK